MVNAFLPSTGGASFSFSTRAFASIMSIKVTPSRLADLSLMPMAKKARWLIAVTIWRARSKGMAPLISGVVCIDLSFIGSGNRPRDTGGNRSRSAAPALADLVGGDHCPHQGSADRHADERAADLECDGGSEGEHERADACDLCPPAHLPYSALMPAAARAVT
ncbi:unknown [Sinorhizobium phage PBC5]|nr:unknown [Sinorhizobium phage PBC5]